MIPLNYIGEDKDIKNDIENIACEQDLKDFLNERFGGLTRKEYKDEINKILKDLRCSECGGLLKFSIGDKRGKYFSHKKGSDFCTAKAKQYERKSSKELESLSYMFDTSNSKQDEHKYLRSAIRKFFELSNKGKESTFSSNTYKGNHVNCHVFKDVTDFVEILNESKDRSIDGLEKYVKDNNRFDNTILALKVVKICIGKSSQCDGNFYINIFCDCGSTEIKKIRLYTKYLSSKTISIKLESEIEKYRENLDFISRIINMNLGKLLNTVNIYVALNLDNNFNSFSKSYSSRVYSYDDIGLVIDRDELCIITDDGNLCTYSYSIAEFINTFNK